MRRHGPVAPAVVAPKAGEVPAAVKDTAPGGAGQAAGQTHSMF